MSERRVVLKKYLLSRLGDSHVLLQQHPKNGKEICVIKKKVGSEIDARFMASVQEQAFQAKVRFRSFDFGLRLEAETEDHLDFLLKC